MKSSHVVCSIFDNKAGIFWQPQLARSSADFVRSVQTAVKDPKSMLHQFPSDYELFILADWDETIGITKVGQDCTPLQRLGSVKDLCPLQ